MALKKLGTIWNRKDKTGKFVRLGDDRNKDPKYNFSVEVTIKDGNGEVVASQTDGFLTVLDPRKSPKANQDALAKVPDLVAELFISTDDQA